MALLFYSDKAHIHGLESVEHGRLDRSVLKGVSSATDRQRRGVHNLIKKILTFAFGVLFSTVVLADFQGQTVTLEYVTATAPADPLVVPGQDPTTVTVPGNITYPFDGGVNCDIAVSATQIVVGPCDFGPFGSGGGVTFNGFRFTQAAAAPDITGVTPTGPVTSVGSNADSIVVNLINQNLNDATVMLDVTFAAPVGNQAQSIPVLSPVGFGLFGLLMAGVSYWARRRR